MLRNAGVFPNPPDGAAGVARHDDRPVLGGGGWCPLGSGRRRHPCRVLHPGHTLRGCCCRRCGRPCCCCPLAQHCCRARCCRRRRLLRPSCAQAGEGDLQEVQRAGQLAQVRLHRRLRSGLGGIDHHLLKSCQQELATAHQLRWHQHTASGSACLLQRRRQLLGDVGAAGRGCGSEATITVQLADCLPRGQH